MMVIGFLMLGVGLVVGVLLALTDPVMLSLINGEGPGERRARDVVRLPRGRTDDRREPTTA